jgi:hypothetical protein
MASKSAKAKTAPVLDPRLVRARARLQAERERVRRASELPKRPPMGVTYRPSPTQGELDITARPGGFAVPSKVYDLSPIDPAAYDPTEPPPLPAMPTNTAPPFVTAFGDTTIVGESFVASLGAWTPPGLVYARQWLRNGAAIPWATGTVYVLAQADVGAMVGCVVRATNAAGTAAAVSAALGPITP